MKFILVSRSAARGKPFSALSRETRLVPPEKLEEAADSIGQNEFLAFDASCVPHDRLAIAIKKLASRPSLRWIVLDPYGAIADPALVLFMGALDYVGPDRCDSKMPRERFVTALEFSDRPIAATEAKAKPASKKKSPSEEKFPGWQKLIPGMEYSFYFLYVGIGDLEQFKRKIGESRFNKLKVEFLGYVEKSFAEHGGRLWMGDGTSALVLFPGDMTGSKRQSEASPLRTCIRMLMDRVIDSYDHFHLETALSLRFAVHRGKAAWQERGKTGNVISDSVNFIYHLGMKFARDGSIYLSEEAADFISPPFLGMFRDAGGYEGRKIAAMRRFTM